MRRLPDDQRADIAAELGVSIADRVESLRLERPGTGLEQAEYAALVELGDPVRLAAGYSGRVTQLIGPEIYPVYVRVLRSVLLMAVPASLGVASLVSLVVESSAGGLVGRLIRLVLTVVVQSAFWVTVVFALVERFGTSEPLRDPVASWTPKHLPDVLGESHGSVTDLATQVAWLTLFGVAIVWQQLLPPIRDDGQRLPMLDPDLWSFWLPLVLVTVVASMAFELVRYRAGGWSRRLADVNVVVASSLPLR